MIHSALTAIHTDEALRECPWRTDATGQMRHGKSACRVETSKARGRPAVATGMRKKSMDSMFKMAFH
jgi:hypothetical protein